MQHAATVHRPNRWVVMAFAAILAITGLVVADCGDGNPSGPSGGWRAMQATTNH